MHTYRCKLEITYCKFSLFGPLKPPFIMNPAVPPLNMGGPPLILRRKLMSLSQHGQELGQLADLQLLIGCSLLCSQSGASWLADTTLDRVTTTHKFPSLLLLGPPMSAGPPIIGFMLGSSIRGGPIGGSIMGLPPIMGGGCWFGPICMDGSIGGPIMDPSIRGGG